MKTPASARWAAIIKRHNASGQSIAEFAAANDLNPRTLSWWRSKLRARSSKAEPAPSPSFVELTLDVPEPTVVLALDDLPAHIVVDKDTDLVLLRDLLRALC